MPLFDLSVFHLDLLAVEVARSGGSRFSSASIIIIFRRSLELFSFRLLLLYVKCERLPFSTCNYWKGRKWHISKFFQKWKKWNSALAWVGACHDDICTLAFCPSNASSVPSNFVSSTTTSAALSRWAANYSFSFLRFQFWFFYLSFWLPPSSLKSKLVTSTRFTRHQRFLEFVFRVSMLIQTQMLGATWRSEQSK